ncbi:MAG: VacJ family lipoprotein [Chromatiales bacterium]|nr:VacJ family lipoprotein [Chromatiales bacterium]
MPRAVFRGSWLASLLLLACTPALGSDGDEPRERNPDPFEPVNRAIFRFNDFGDRYFLRPVAVGWERATPGPMRRGASNFFSNLQYPVVIINQFLQGKFAEGGRDTARFVINSTIGLGGLFDPASELGLRENDEDFGQTLAVWGVPQGPYLMVPLVGPRTARHAVGSVTDLFIDPLVIYPDTTVRNTTAAVFIVHDRSTLLSADRQVREAFDPYIFLRDAYLQNRRFKILDGEIPEDDLLDDWFDDWDD